jgi:tetratricopeptide (TPR) repeat protein
LIAIDRVKTGYIIGGVFGTAILILSISFFIRNSFRQQIPGLPDFKNLSRPLQQQLSIAWGKAHRKPSSGNLGMLGIMYHSNMFYDKATRCYELAIKRNKKEWLWDYYLGYLNQEMGDPNTAFKIIMKSQRKIRRFSLPVIIRVNVIRKQV